MVGTFVLGFVHMKKVILLTGPGGAGKSTIAELIAKNCGYIFIDGDQEDTEFFPDGGQWLPENRGKLIKAHDKILFKTQQLVKDGKKVVVDYIIFGNYLEYIEKFKKAFGDDLDVKVLFPSEAETIHRDAKRQSYTTGPDRIRAVRQELETIKKDIGPANFLDTSGESPEETVARHFQCAAK